MRVLIAIDSSIYADAVLSTVRQRIWPEGTEFLMVTAVDTAVHWEAQQQFLHQGQVILDARVSEVQKSLKAYPVKGEVLEGLAGPAIVKTARDWAANLIVLGSHGDTGVRKHGVGSVAAAVVNEAPCSVEIVKLAAVHAHTHKSSIN